MPVPEPTATPPRRRRSPWSSRLLPHSHSLSRELADFLPDDSDVTPDWVEHLAVDFPFLKTEWFGNQLWKYIASGLYILLAFYVSKFLDYLTRALVHQWAKQTDAAIYKPLIDLLNGPVKMVIFAILLYIGLSLLRWPLKVQAILPRVFILAVAVSITYTLVKFIDVIMGYWRVKATSHADHALDAQLLPFARKCFKAFVIVVAALVTAQNLGVNVTAAITSLSIGGLAVGLAAQDTLANFFGAVAVLVDKPFRIGETIRLDTVEGVVESVGMRSTRVRNGNGFLVNIPNKTVGNATITNVSRRTSIHTEMNLRLAGDTPAEKVKRALAILDEVFRGQPMVQDLTVSFNKFADSAPNILIAYNWNGVDDAKYQAGMQQLNLEVKQRLEAEGISLAMPGQVVVKQG